MPTSINFAVRAFSGDAPADEPPKLLFALDSNVKFNSFWGQVLAMSAAVEERVVVAQATRCEVVIPGGTTLTATIPQEAFITDEDEPKHWTGIMRIAAASVGPLSLFPRETVQVSLS